MFLTIKLCIAFKLHTKLFEMELFLTFKQCLRSTEMFNIELFWHLTVCKQNYIYTKLN